MHVRSLTQGLLQLLRGTWSAIPVLETNRLWGISQLHHLLALYPKASCHCTVAIVSCTGFVYLIWEKVMIDTGTTLWIHAILNSTVAKKGSHEVENYGAFGKCFFIVVL